MNRDEYKQFWNETLSDREGTFDSGKVITDGEVAAFLVHSAREQSNHWCDTHFCEVCNAFASMWWDWMSELPGITRIRVQRFMREAGIPFPPSPSEEVGNDAVPASLV